MSRILSGAVIVSLLATPVLAGVIGPKKPSESVTLVPGPGGTFCFSFEEELSITIDDGGEDVDFSVPPGKVVMVTDISAILEGSAGSEGGMYIGARGTEKPIFMSATLNANGLAHVQTHFVTPVRVPGVPCVNLVGIGSGPVTVPTLHEMRLTGFLAKDR